MSLLRKKSSLRATFQEHIKLRQSALVGKLSARYLFRAAIRFVIEYKDWINGDVLEEIGDDVANNVKLSHSKKSSDSELSVKDRAILLIPAMKRSPDENAYIYSLFNNISAFQSFPDDVRNLLAIECLYQFVPKERIITKQDHKPFALYYVVKGQLQILKKFTDNITGEVKEIEVGTLEPGDMFGMMSLLHNVNRSATVVSKTPVDLLLITRSTFNAHLKNILMEEWVILRDALVNFNYFKGWSEETMRECCVLSKVVNFKTNEVLLGDGKGQFHYVYFILSGECQLIEHMLIEKNRVGKEIQYKLYDFQQEERNPRQKIGRAEKVELPKDYFSKLIMDKASPNDTNVTELGQTTSPEDYIKLISSKKASTNITMDRLSVITVTLQDIINEWHEITDVVEMLRVEPCVSSLETNLKNVSTVFMQIGIFSRGACFGLGEHLKNRRVVSKTPVSCLLIPRYWLLQHNRANIWTRVKEFLNCKYPNNKQLLKKYVESRTWAKYKREYINKIINECPKLRNDTKRYNVPYSIRIYDDIFD